MKKNNLSRILIIIVIVLVGLAVVKDFLIKTAITTMGPKVVGAKIEIGGFSLGLLTQKIRITNFKLYNPPGFPNEPMVNFPEIRLDYDVMAFIQGKLHARLIIVNMKEMSVVINKEGKLNVDSLKIIQDQKKKQQEEKDKKEDKKLEIPPFQIDVMKLNLERVVVKDYSKSDVPKIEVHELGLKEKEFKNINSVFQLTTAILWAGVSETAIKSLGLSAAATMLGVGFFPAAIVGVIVGKDSSKAEFGQSADKVFDTAAAVLKQYGEIKEQDKKAGLLKGRYEGADITVMIGKGETKRSKASVSARKYMLPKPEIAGGFVYQLQERLK